MKGKNMFISIIVDLEKTYDRFNWAYAGYSSLYYFSNLQNHVEWR